MKYKSPKNVLELGTAIGYSSLFFSDYILPGGKITTFERDENYYEIAKKNIKNAGKEDKPERQHNIQKS